VLRTSGAEDGAVVATVTLTIAAPDPLSVVVAGEGVQLASLKLPGSLHVTCTSPLKPLCGVKVTVYFAIWPGEIVAGGEVVNVKSLPVPDSVRLWLEPATLLALSVIIRVATRVPAADGV
jgi:hypothetical protein